jgi:toxin YoeB
MRKIILDKQAVDDLKWWIQQDKRIALKIMELIEILPNNPVTGKGKP